MCSRGIDGDERVVVLRDIMAAGVGQRVRVVGQHRLAPERVVGLLERGVEHAALDVDVADVVESAARHSDGSWEESLCLDEIIVRDEEPVVEREDPPVAEASDALSVQAADRGLTHHYRPLGPVQPGWERPAAGRDGTRPRRRPR